MIRRALPWAALAAVLAVVLVIGGRGGGEDPTVASRVQRIASEVRCPTCESLSAAESDAPASVAVRDVIRQRVEAGDSDGAIRAFLVGRYGEDILLRPPSTGVASLVWVLPVVALVVGAAGLGLAFRRWRRSLAIASPEDEAIVAQAIGRG